MKKLLVFSAVAMLPLMVSASYSDYDYAARGIIGASAGIIIFLILLYLAFIVLFIVFLIKMCMMCNDIRKMRKYMEWKLDNP